VGQRAWLVVLGGGVALAGLHLATATSGLAGLAFALAVVAGTIAVGAAIRVNRPARPDAWAALAVALGTNVVGIGLYLVHGAPSVARPSTFHVVFAVSYLAYGTSLWRLARRGDGSDPTTLIDASILGLGLGVLLWTLLLGPFAVNPSLTAAERVVAMAYLTGDLALVPLLAGLVFARRAREPAHVVLLAGFLLLFVADARYGAAQLAGTYAVGSPWDALYPLAFGCMAAAAWHPSAAAEPKAVEVRPQLSRRRLVALAGAAVLAPVTLLVHRTPYDLIGQVTAAAAILMILLVIARMAGLVRRIDEQSRQLQHLSRTDPLTGAANRRVLDERLRLAVARLQRDGVAFAFGMLDLDHFKDYNDTRGHTAGDALLVEVVRRWHAALREVDLLARYGGEEFAILLPGCGRDEALAVTERLRAVVPHDQTCSAGLVIVTAVGATDDLIGMADRALYAAKHQGRDRTVVAEPH
jgi:diguanylate cyclase (GGDEF)-like protein